MTRREHGRVPKYGRRELRVSSGEWQGRAYLYIEDSHADRPAGSRPIRDLFFDPSSARALAAVLIQAAEDLERDAPAAGPGEG